MQWSELDLIGKTWEIPASRTKNKLPHVVLLSDPVIGIIQSQKALQEVIGKSGYVFTCTGNPFSGWSRSKQRLDGRAGIEPWRLHDLRRTMVTGMNEMGTQPHIVEAIVNHISGHRSGVAGVYNRALYLEERRQPLDSWADHVVALLKTNAKKT
jgi:integrase